MVALETLIIGCTEYEDMSGDEPKIIDFTQFLMVCPASLTTLTVKGVYLTCYEVPFNTTSIKHLVLKRTRLTSELANCIEACFPTLSTLELDVSLSYDEYKHA
jgi:hypothetical protein